ncbi:hypothetical protein GOODEAATRI_002106, partial [Goodea atripinnis]
EFMHTDESSKCFRGQLSGGGRRDDIATLYHRPRHTFTSLCMLRQVCVDRLPKMFVSIVNICVPFGRPTQGPFPDWLKISASIKHTHTFLPNEPWPSVYT